MPLRQKHIARLDKGLSLSQADLGLGECLPSPDIVDYLKSRSLGRVDGVVPTFKLVLDGIDIEGDLDLSDLGDPSCPAFVIEIERCHVKGRIILDNAHLRRLSLRETRSFSISLSEATVLGTIDLSLIEPFDKVCDVDLWSAQIGGSLEMDGAVLAARKGRRALDASLCSIRASAHLRNGFRAEGEVRFHNADIGKTLDLSSASFSNFRGTAVNLDRTQIGGSLHVRKSTRFRGNLSGISLSVVGNIECLETIFEDAGRLPVNLFGASVDGNLIFSGITLRPHPELRADAEMILRLDALQIKGRARFNGMAFGHAGPQGPEAEMPFMRFSLSDSSIGTLQMLDVRLEGSSEIDMRGTHVKVLDDLLKTGWGGADTRLRLRGFRYERIGAVARKDEDRSGERRLSWVRRSLETRQGDNRFSPGPYYQLAETLRRQGLHAQSTDATVAARLHELKNNWPWFLKPYGFAYWLFFRFGYSSTRALITLICAIGIGWAGVKWAQSSDIMVVQALPVATLTSPSGRLGFEISPETNILDSQVCKKQIDPLYYAMDVFVPLIDFEQESRCRIRDGGLKTEVWKMAKMAYTLLGWILTSLALATFSGVVGRAKET